MADSSSHLRSDLDAGREQVAQACRVLAHRGLVEGVLGHVSLRFGEGMLLRCRGPQESGLRFTKAQDIRLIGLDGTALESLDGWKPPSEWPIHGELMRLRTDVNCVVHAHPPSALVVGLAELPLRPVFGAFNVPALRMAVEGVPVYRRSVLITSPELVQALHEAMEDKDVCILQGHGVAVIGDDIAQAISRTIDLDALTSVTRDLAQINANPPEVPPEDLADLSVPESKALETMVWRSLLADAEADAQRPQPSRHPPN